MSIVQTTFNYAALAPGVRTVVETATDRLHVLERKTGEQIIEIGRTLIDVKAHLGHGQFGSWLESEFDWSARTAQRFMRVASVIPDIRHGVAFEAKALYAIASGDIPDDIREEFIERAEAGERVTHKDVKAAIRQRKPYDDSDVDYPVVGAVQVDPYTGEILGVYQESTLPDVDDEEPDEPQELRPIELPTMPPAPKPTPIYAPSSGMSPIQAASAILALRALPTAPINATAEYLIDMSRGEIDAFLDDLSGIVEAIERIRMRASLTRAQAGKTA